MKSSTSAGERRWASSGRRGGMTVIGKVVVPKPINLPSQRLENHGQDPNVEVAPKGTLCWGGKSSSTASNPWGSSTPSPNTDAGGSPSYLSGRPSSGGSGTRSSTASSDRAYDSRPSSASGLVTSNQTSLTSPRPRSAETRPGSSHLSRFAESAPENSGAWGATGTAEKLGVTSSIKDGFSLASGDFPTLGAQKDSSGKNIEFQDHDDDHRPDSSSSSGVPPARERNATFIDGESSASTNVKKDHTDSWKKDNPAYREDGMGPNAEKWHGDPQPYHNAHIRPHHYEAWRGPSVNNPPGGVWYRGPPPYGNPVPPGGFPMEPFPYFHPQMPGAALGNNPQSVPPPGAGPRGPHPKNGDMYRPHIPGAYIRPGMPMRPGFYPGPMPLDGYFGPPIGYCNSNEPNIPFMGMEAGPGVYNRYSVQTGPDPGNHHARFGGYDYTGKALVPEHDVSGRPHDTRGPYKVLLKQHGGMDNKDDQKWEGNKTSTATCNKKGEQPRTLKENEWEADHKNEGINPRKTVGEPSYQTSDIRGGCSVRTKVNSHENMANRKAVDDISVNKMDHAAYSFPEYQQPLLATPEESSLIQKIEGLNAKARDARHDVSSVHTVDRHMNEIQVVKANHANDADSGYVHHERSHPQRIFTPHSHGLISTGDMNLESTNDSGVANSRRSHGMQGRLDHRGGKGRINAREGDDWQKRSPVVDYPNKVSAVQGGNSSIVGVQDHHDVAMLASEKTGAYPQTKDERQVGVPIFDPNDLQRVKMKEVAQQRLKQHQKEEEERINRQKANARAKLEELNRRSQAVDGSGHESGPIQNRKEGSQLAESVTVNCEPEVPSLIAHPNVGSEISKSNTDRDESSTNSSSELVLAVPDCAPTQVQNVSVSAQTDVHNADACKNTSNVSSTSVFKQKRTGFRKKQSVLPETTDTEKVSSTSIPEALKGHDNVPVGPNRSYEVVADGSVPHFGSSLPESSHQKRTNRNAKNKHKLDPVSSAISLPSSALKETNSANIFVDSDKQKPQEAELFPSSLQPVIALKDAEQSLDQHSSLSNEESQVRVNNLSKSQNSRRVQRNPQINKAAEKFHTGDAVVWAPIRSHNRAEVADEASDKTAEAVASTVKDSMQNINAKNKRADIEIYVPKPVAKELAQVTVCAPSSGQATSDEAVDSAGLGSQGTVDRQNKQGKVHGSWRQRAASESISIQGLQGLDHTSNSNRNVQRSVEHQKPKKAQEGSSEKEKPKFSGKGNAHDELNIPEISDSVPALRDQGTGRGQRQPFRGHKSMGNSRDIDQNKKNSWDTENSAPSLPLQISSTDSIAPQDGRGGGVRSITHWIPKSQDVQPDNGGQNINVEVSRGKKNESISRGGMLPLSQHMETVDVTSQHHHGSVKTRVEEAPSAGHQEAKREKKPTSLKAHPHLPSQGLVGPSESPPFGSTDNRHEHHPFSGFRKNGNQNSRFNNSRGGWNSAGQDNRRHNQPANQERQRENSHYEYQPVGAYNNNNKPYNLEGPDDGSHNTGARFRESGQGNMRRGGGNFYGRQTNRARVDGEHE